MKKYLVSTLKRYIPFLVISFAIFVAVTITLFSNVQVSYEYFKFGDEINAYNDLDGPSAMIIVLGVLLFGFTCVAPIIANSYRYSLRSADFYNQIGRRHRSVRLINNLVLLLAIIVSFTVAFILGISVLAIKNVLVYNQGTVVTPMAYGEGETISEPFMYHYAYFAPIYFILLLGAVINFFISYFLATRSNNALNSVITLVLGQVILFTGLMTPLWYVTVITDGEFAIKYLAGVKTPSFIAVVMWTVFLFGQVLKGEPFNKEIFKLTTKEDTAGLVLVIVSLVLFFALGAYSIYKFLKEDETSGEFAGKPQGRDALQTIIFHIGAGIVGLWELSMSAALNDMILIQIVGIFSFIPSIIIFGALYYVFYSLERRNFRLTKKDLIILLPIFITDVILGVASIIVNSALYTEM